MRVAVLGANGQLGHDILAAHAAGDGAGLDLVALTRADLDVTEVAAIDAALARHGFDALVNCTSYHRTDEAEDNATLAFTVNAHAVAAMAAHCAGRGARFVHVSTDYVFGGDRDRATPLDETAATAPVNVYGASKAMGETLARHAHDDTAILRVASLFGTAGASGKGGNFVETMLRLARERGRLKVVDDQVMSPTATADIARAVLALLAREAGPGIYHVVNTGSASWYEFAREIVRRAGIDAVVEPCSSAEFPTRAARPRYSALDNARARAALHDMPDWPDALQRYLAAKGHV